MASSFSTSSSGVNRARRSGCLIVLFCSCVVAACVIQTAEAAYGIVETRVATASSVFHRSILNVYPDARTANMVCSPWGIWRVYRLLQAGADGRTLNEMLGLLDAEHADLAVPDLSHSGAHGPTGIELFSVDAMFTARSLEGGVFGQYCSRVEHELGTPVQRGTDFSSPEGAANLINQYFLEGSAGRIDGVASAGDMTPETKLAVLNGVYVKAPWAEGFQPIGEDVFMGLDREGQRLERTCEYMQLWTKKSELEYLDGSVKAFRLPYAHRDLALYLFMPESLQEFEESESFADVLNELIDYMHLMRNERNVTRRQKKVRGEEEQVEVIMPKFHIGGDENKYNVIDVLRSLEVVDLFVQANLSRMTTQAVAVDVFKQSSEIFVTERETIASSTTASYASERSLGFANIVEQIKIDGPFIFQLRYQKNYESGPGPAESDVVLFSGHVTDCQPKPTSADE